jgi:hypothetical protein
VNKGKLVLMAALALLGSTAFTRREASKAALSGDLAKPIDQYSGDEFRALVDRLSYGQGAERSRSCRGGGECDRGRRVNVRVDAVADADSLSANNVSQFGVVAARAINRGNDTERRYGMRGNGATYFLIVLPGGAWRLEELTMQGGASHRMVASGRLTACGHPFVRGARADFKTCSQASGGLFHLASSQQDGDSPLWISCAAGCCTAEL